MIELEHSLILVGQKRFFIAPNGKADLKGAVRLRVKPGGLREDAQEISGADGAVRTVLGYADAELTAEIQIWDEEELPKLKRLNDLFRPRREQKSYQPVGIVHPAATRWNIKQVYVFALEQTPWTAKDGTTVTLSMREWQPKEKKKTTKTKKVDQSAPAISGSGIPEEIDITAPSKRGVRP